jgi:hypothetical protein
MAKRVLRGLSELGGITFIAWITIEPSSNANYGDSNKLGRVVVPTEPEWRKVMDGEALPPAPGTRLRPKVAHTGAPKPAWNQSAVASAPAPAWNSPPVTPPAKASEPMPVPTKPAVSGPAWLNG